MLARARDGIWERHRVRLRVVVALTIGALASAIVAGCGSAGSQERAGQELAFDPVVHFVSTADRCIESDFVDSSVVRPRTYLQWRPPGSEILFAHWHRIFAVAADGSVMQQLAEVSGSVEFESESYVAGHVESADVSSDGRKVAITVCRKQTGGGYGRYGRLLGRVLYESSVLDRDDGSSKRLGFGRGVAWAPGGERLAFYRSSQVGTDYEEREERRLHTVRADGSDQRTVSRSIDRSPRWSPDGRQLAFVRSNTAIKKESVARYVGYEDLHLIYVAETDGSRLRRLTLASSDPAWSPDGTRLAFARAERAGIGLYTIGVDGGNLQRVTSVEGWWRRRPVDLLAPKPEDPSQQIPQAWIPTVAWSPDGTRLLYSCGLAICVVGVDGTPVGKSPVDPGGQPLAAWSPDGTRIAVLGDASLGGVPVSAPYYYVALYTMAPNGTDIRILVGVASQEEPVLARGASSTETGSADEDACDTDGRPSAAPARQARDCRPSQALVRVGEPVEDVAWNRDRPPDPGRLA